ncbi:MAG: ABC transporter permease, partial [Akkermansiaceae bacterium]|nr:ABC transporter permease [Akkermansiaceae bacterium]
MVEAVAQRYPGTQRVVSYLANTLAADGKEVPYSMVTAASPEAAPFLPPGLQADGVVINSWLAEDLEVAPGQELELKYFRLAGGNRLVEDSRKFRIHSVVPLEGLASDQLWMPDFPGVAEAEDAQDWAPGLPLDLDRIRQVDEDYWDDYRGTPKAFFSVEAGRDMFANRWGEFTSLRIPVEVAPRDEIEAGLRPVLRPEMAGLLMHDVRTEAVVAAESPVDIAGLFLSMSFFLIVAAMSLTAMLFRFNVEQRNRESGLLAALGVPGAKVLRWRLFEGLVIVGSGGVIGLIIAIAYSLGILRFLETIWS